MYRLVGANFDQMHMDTNLEWAHEHPDVEVVGVCDERPGTSTGSLDRAVTDLDLADDAVYDDLDACLAEADPDIVLGCPRTAEHADFVERVVNYDVDALAIEKPLAVTLADADRMLDAVDDELFVVNWPATWDPVLHTVKRLIEEGTVGDVVEVQYYGGNAGAPPDGSWFYDAADGGSMLDYLGYGATFSTWFRDGELPETVSAERHVPPEMEVDVQSATVCHYDAGLATLQTTWRMLTDPWNVEPQPMKGYEIVGTEGAISTRERDVPVRVTTEERTEGYVVDPGALPDRYRNLVAYLVHCLDEGETPEGPSDPEFCRDAHRIVATARESAEAGETLPLAE
ncbi:gfo/Idh/MocA family oxidoreductase [Halobacteriales archaeon QH_8_68_33]|nr:MAG: gfo/Idh/MocA family oxidoreductase [Halobacteriales archaeon QH_8_68_33]